MKSEMETKGGPQKIEIFDEFHPGTENVSQDNTKLTQSRTRRLEIKKKTFHKSSEKVEQKF